MFEKMCRRIKIILEPLIVNPPSYKAATLSQGLINFVEFDVSVKVFEVVILALPLLHIILFLPFPFFQHSVFGSLSIA